MSFSRTGKFWEKEVFKIAMKIFVWETSKKYAEVDIT